MSLFRMVIVYFLFISSTAKECNVLYSATSAYTKNQRSWIHLNSTCQMWLTPRENQLIQLTVHRVHTSVNDNKCQTTCYDQTCTCNFSHPNRDNYLLIRTVQSELLCFCGSLQIFLPISIKSSEIVSVVYKNKMSSNDKTHASISFTFQQHECGQRHITQSPGIVFSREENSTDIAKMHFHFVKCTWIIHGNRGNLISLNLAATPDGNCSMFNITVTPVNESRIIHTFCSGDSNQQVIIPPSYRTTLVKMGFRNIKYKITWMIVTDNVTTTSNKLSNQFLSVQKIMHYPSVLRIVIISLTLIVIVLHYVL